MTTIISNGYYLLADHRVVRNANARDLITDKNNGNTINADGYDKLELGKALYFSGYKIKAFACAGSVWSAQWILRENDKTDHQFDLLTWLTEMERAGPEYFSSRPISNTLVGITECHRTIVGSWYFSSSGTEKTTRMFDPGVIVAKGSGGSNFAKIQKMLVRKDLALSDVFSYCAMHDNHSSPTYGVYGNREDHKFIFVDPGKQELIAGHNRVADALKIPI